MDDDKYKGKIKVSSEKAFIYQDSFNRGHVQFPRMIINCLQLSATAKTVYGIISGHVFEHGDSAFPSVERIAMACDISRKTATNYIKELDDKGFIRKKRGGNGKTNSYYLMDADMVPHLHVSEMFWSAATETLKENEGYTYGLVYDAVYAISKMFYLDGVHFGDIPVTDDMKATLKEMMKAAIEKELDKMRRIPSKQNKLPENIGVDLGVSNGLPQDIDKWKATHFVIYFYMRYREITGNEHEGSAGTNKKHFGIIRRYLKHVDGNNSAVKKYIDAFFEISYDIQTLENFGLGGKIGELDTFIATGKKPFYLMQKEKQKQIKEAVQENKGMSIEDFMKRLKGEDDDE